ncbi:anti-sigma factor domain-containing protein [Psychrobacillus glaciei]|uniref:anti-sigma factor domain-containing protein n=1 Tax=Psychrobacillus glaciei TaxID=2283160 RepID=UPI00124DA515|nr:hypothetical protein [Psychrobacillus glaciei]
MMRVYKGIVCEKKNKYSVFITKEGEFLRGIPLEANPEIGEEAHFHLFEATTQGRKWLKPSILGPVFVAAMLFIFIIVSFIPNPDIALAYVQVDGKNAIELGVNKNGQVVTLRSLTETPIELDDWEGHPFDLVLEKAIATAQMSPITKQLAITTIYENEKKPGNMRKMIENAVEEVQNDHKDKLFLMKESTIEERNKANKRNTSIQKLKQKERQINNGRKKLDNYIKDVNKENHQNKKDDFKDKYMPSNQKNENNKESMEKNKEKRIKEQVKLKEEQEKQKAKQAKELEKQQENLNKSNEQATKEREKVEKEKEKEREKAEKEKEKEKEKAEKEKEKEREQAEKEKEKESKDKQHKNDDEDRDE